MTGQDIANAARYLLLDPNAKFWTDFLTFIKEGIQEIVKMKPELATGISTLDVAASAKHTIANTSKFLIDVTRNVGADGSTNGPSITAVDVRNMDRMAPGWRKQTGRWVEHYMYDMRYRNTVWLYPVAGPTANKVEIVTAIEPVVPTALNSTLSLRDEYFGPLLSYVLFRSYSRDSKEASQSRAVQHYQAFLQQMGVYPQTEAAAVAGEREQGGLR